MTIKRKIKGRYDRSFQSDPYILCTHCHYIGPMRAHGRGMAAECRKLA